MYYYIMQNNKIVLYNKNKKALKETISLIPEFANLEIKSTELDIVDFEFKEPIKTIGTKPLKRVALQQNAGQAIDKPTKPDNTLPVSFGGVKNNWSDSLIQNGYEYNKPAILGGDNLNYMLDSVGKSLNFSNTVSDYIVSLGKNETPIIDSDNKLSSTKVAFKVYRADEIFALGDKVVDEENNVFYVSLQDNNKGNELSNNEFWQILNISIKNVNDLRFYRDDETYSEKNSVYKIIDNSLTVFISKQDDNIGHDPELDTEETYWRKQDFGMNPATVDSLGGIKPDNKTTFVDENGTLSAPKYSLFDLVQKDHILSYEEKEGLERLGEYVYKEAQDGQYGYPDFYEKCIEEYNEAVENQEEIEGITIKINTNGHKFYDIKDKSSIDTIYETTGIAWYYGIDEENQRIVLPRNDYFFQSGETSNAGKSIEAGLPNITGNAGVASAADFSGAFYFRSSVKRGTGTNNDAAYAGFDASRSNKIYGNSTTVQPPALSVVIYMVVGNTPIVQAKTNTVDITTSENDTIPLFTPLCFDFKPNHACWLKADTKVNGNMYESAYSELLKISKGEETKYGTGFKVTEENEKLSDSDTDYSEYWVINEEEMTFKTPSKTSFSDSEGLYFKVANALENLELINTGEILEACNTKVNLPQAANSSMPGNEYISINRGASGATYVMPADGYLTVGVSDMAINQGYMYIYYKNSEDGFTRVFGEFLHGSQHNKMTTVAVSKGMVIKIEYIGTFFQLDFTYAIGAEREAA